MLVVDEAQHLRNDVLEDLRLLTSYAMDPERRPCLLLVGLTELRRRLMMAVHESLTQRIVVRYHLSGLTREELPAYLSHRLQLAGCSLPLFEPAVIEALFEATQGLPRNSSICSTNSSPASNTTTPHRSTATTSGSEKSATADSIDKRNPQRLTILHSESRRAMPERPRPCRLYHFAPPSSIATPAGSMRETTHLASRNSVRDRRSNKQRDNKRAGAASPAPAALDRHAWQQHCRALFQTPIAA